jgi:hypothetical protein
MDEFTIIDCQFLFVCIYIYTYIGTFTGRLPRIMPSWVPYLNALNIGLVDLFLLHFSHDRPDMKNYDSSVSSYLQFSLMIRFFIFIFIFIYIFAYWKMDVVFHLPVIASEI